MQDMRSGGQLYSAATTPPLALREITRPKLFHIRRYPVTATPLTCVNCKRPFPANGELAAIPDARKVAFDELRHRAWRICGQCGTWNLLGSEATAAALPELLTRYAAGVPEMNSGIGVVQLGSQLDLICIDDRAVDGAGDAAIAKRRRTLGWVHRFGVAVAALLVLEWVWVGRGILAGPRRYVLAGRYAMVVATSCMVLAECFWKKRFRVEQRGATPILGAIGLAAGVVMAIVLRGRESLEGAEVLIGAWGAVGMALGSLHALPLVHRKLSDGTKVGLNPYQVRRVSISWHDDAITLDGLPGGRRLTGTVASEELAFLLGYFHKRVTSAMAEAAHRLVRTTGGLSGLLRSLDGWREDHGGRIVIADLPPVYRVALDLALAQRA
ncbi:MAG TPA: hypothetical protein VHW65_08765, partial [Gemmatimonadales bacterium]|nr:hypothetical protein [Gemmatimonadales bacterium]